MQESDEGSKRMPNSLKVIRGKPNPKGAAEAELFLFSGDVMEGPVTELQLEDGVRLPERRPDLVERPFRLKILHVNDLHGHIVRFHTSPSHPVFSKIVYYARQLRRRIQDDPRAAVLFLSAGDDLVGTVLDELLGDDPESYVMHAGYRLYSEAGVDASAIGNHDLDMGSQLLARAIEEDAAHPILSANLVGSRWLQDRYYPAALMVVKGVRVGLIGLSTPAALKPQQDAGLHVANPIQAVHNLLPALRPLCDVIVVLSHLGYSLSSSSGSVSEAGDVELAQSLPPGAVHLIVGGHTHHVLNEQGLTPDNIVNGIPIVQAGTLGSFVGEVDVTVHEQACASVTNARLTSTPTLPTDETFEAEVVRPILEKAQPFLEEELGMVADHPDLTTDVVRNAFASDESALANFITDALVIQTRANGYNVDLAAIDDSCVRCGLPTGRPLKFSDWFQMMPFPDTIRLCWLTGADLKALLEDNARRAGRPDEPNTDRGFLQFSRQVRYTIDLGAERADATARNITVNGRPLAEQLERSFLVACTSFTRKSAQTWQRLVGRMHGFSFVDVHSFPHLDPHLFLRDVLVAYIREHGGVTEEGGARRDGRVEFV